MRRQQLVETLLSFGRDAVSFEALEPGLDHWESDQAVVVYCDTPGGWVGVGAPFGRRDALPEAARRFAEQAARQGRRASFFACDDPARLGDAFDRLKLGEQPLWDPAEWEATKRAHRSLREQLRRARAKGTSVRRVTPEELSPLRPAVMRLAEAWLASRPMEPMGFLVTLSLFEEPALHRYYVAERGGELVALLSIVPIGEGRGLLVEDLVRDRAAPNGTTEMLFDDAMRDAARDGVPMVTWGLAPLAGKVPLAMRMLGALGRGLYDFRGLHAFKARLHPRAWEPVWMVYPRGTSAALHLLDALRAFAEGSLIAFGWRTVARRPLVLAWLLTLALIPWTAGLAVLLTFHEAAPLFGFPRPELFGWVLFDALFALLLVRAFWRHRPGRYLLLALAAGADATLSTLHLAHAGLGASSASALVRIASMVAPTLAAFALLRCANAARSFS